MVIDNKFKRFKIGVDDPRDRCIATIKSGQCTNCKVTGTDYCALHGSNKSQIKQNGEKVHQLYVAKWQERVSELANNQGIKSLREEIGILRLLLENMLQKCNDQTDLLLYSSRISDLVVKIEKVVISCDKLESKMGRLLDKDEVLQIAAVYVQIINNYVKDPEIIQQISSEILTVTKNVGDPLNVDYAES